MLRKKTAKMAKSAKKEMGCRFALRFQFWLFLAALLAPICSGAVHLLAL
jgi:hypothetical protein